MHPFPPPPPQQQQLQQQPRKEQQPNVKQLNAKQPKEPKAKVKNQPAVKLLTKAGSAKASASSGKGQAGWISVRIEGALPPGSTLFTKEQQDILQNFMKVWGNTKVQERSIREEVTLQMEVRNETKGPILTPSELTAIQNCQSFFQNYRK